VSGEDYNNDLTHSSSYSSSPPHCTGTQVLGGLIEMREERDRKTGEGEKETGRKDR
jgi:hypothetical protein